MVHIYMYIAHRDIGEDYMYTMKDVTFSFGRKGFHSRHFFLDTVACCNVSPHFYPCIHVCVATSCGTTTSSCDASR